jgi:hypothetical protein
MEIAMPDPGERLGPMHTDLLKSASCDANYRNPFPDYWRTDEQTFHDVGMRTKSVQVPSKLMVRPHRSTASRRDRISSPAKSVETDVAAHD